MLPRSFSQPIFRYISAQGMLLVVLVAGMLLADESRGLAIDILRGSPGSSVSGKSAGQTPSAGQTSTAATSATAQQAETAALAARAQSSLMKATAALQAQQKSQSAARSAAAGGGSSAADGLATGGLVPQGSTTSPTSPGVQLIPVQIDNNPYSQISLTQGGTISFPSGTGNDKIVLTGSGTINGIAGSVPFTGTVTEYLPAGSSVTLAGGGTVGYASGSDAAIPVTVPSSIANFGATGVNVSSWSGIGGLSQSTSATSPATVVTIQQNQEQALLNWTTFNVGKNTTLDFDQSLGGANVGNWIAFNTVAPNVAPSQIFGSINAAGQVYVINQNGIIFGGTSQVNAGALVASSLPLNTNLAGGDGQLGRGLLNNPDLQFLFSQLDVAAGPQGPTLAFTPEENTPAPNGSAGGLVAKVDGAGNVMLVQPDAQDGDVVVETGAQLSSPTTPEHVGGKIALIGPNVSNAGTISSPDGQVILAAGLQVGFSASTDPSLRGLDVTVGQVSDPSYAAGTAVSGTVLNVGDIEASRADVMLTGENLNQLGVIDSTTSVALNGRIDLLANYDSTLLTLGVNGFNGVTGLYPTASGEVTFGAGSLDQIQPETSSADTVVGTSLALPSQMNVQGETIHLAENSEILAPSANLTFNAGTWLASPEGYSFYNTVGQVYLDAGATIDVSGSENVAASVTDNIISVQLRGTELANSPLQQNGPLRGQTVQVDISQTGTYDGVNWVGTPIGDVSGYVNLVQRTVGQLTDAGGNVSINAGGSVVMQPGSAVNVSGGWINYAGGTVQTTKVESGGQIYDISQATPDRVYQGIYNGFDDASAKYGLSNNYTSKIVSGAEYEAGYLQGGNGGALKISAPAMALDGTLVGNTVDGSRQLTPIAQLSTTYAGASFLPTTLAISGIPNASSLALSFVGQNPNDVADNYPVYSPAPPVVTFQNGASNQTPADPFAVDPVTGDALPLRSDRVAEVVLSPDLVNSDGFGNLSISNIDGTINVPANISLITPLAGSVSASGAPVAGGTISLSAANLDIEGSITAPGGSILLSVYDFSPYAILPLGSGTPPPDPTRGNFTLGSGASLSTAGLILAPDENGDFPLLLNGGTVDIASYNANLEAGSTVDVSGGASVSLTGKQTFGVGGKIAIAAGQDLTYAALLGGQLNLQSTLKGYSGSTGGTLAISTPLIQIGGSTLQNGDASGANTLWLDETDSSGHLLNPEFFSQGGFGTFTLTGLGRAVVDAGGNPVVDSSGNAEFDPAILIAPMTVIKPVAESWQIVDTSATGIALVPTVLPLPSERTPISFNFNTPGVTDALNNAELVLRGDFVMGTGAVIQTDPQTNPAKGVSIKGQTAAVLGSIIVPAGTISVSGAGAFPNAANLVLLEPTVDLGPQSLLSAQGAVELTPNQLGYTTGSILPGGTINVSGNIVAEAGSTLNVSGASGTLDVLPGQAGRTSTGIYSPMVPLQENSNGGSIKLTGIQELFTDATLLGAAGGPTAQGGSLTINSGMFVPENGVETPLDPTLLVTQDGTSIPVPDYYPTGETAIGNQVVDAQGNPVAGMGYFAVDKFDNPASGFNSLTLSGSIQFEGPINLSAPGSLILAQDPQIGGKSDSGGIIIADSQVNLSAAYIALGQAFQGPLTEAEQQAPVFVDSNNGVVNVPPVSGTGQLFATAGDLIDVGNLSLQNIGQANLTAAQGDIRGDGTLDVAGTLNLVAGQIYPTTETTFTLAAFDVNGNPGAINITGSGQRQLPYSAGGTLNVYASDITQSGVLRAPVGKINLGSGVTGASPTDPIAGEQFDSTQQIVLGSGSTTSVSAVDPLTGQALEIPYGINVNGVEWVDPAGNNITTAGNGPNAIPAKSITISAANVADQAGSSIDVSGGGDIFAYQFVPGTGGTNDVLASNSSFAVVPGYQPKYAPDYSSSDYANSTLAFGEQIYLAGSPGLPAGTYTLLPARYALLPGAFLVTPKSGNVPSSISIPQADGTSLVSGYLFNGATPPAAGQPLLSSFQVDPPAQVKALADYDISSGNTFLAASATANNVAIPRLPVDAGQLVLAVQSMLSLDGSVLSQTPTGGQGSLVDIASPSAILIAGSDADLSQVGPDTLVLSASGLSAFGADSLLIGGYRGDTTTAGTPVTVTTSSLTVDNSGAGNILEGPDVILVANDQLTLDANAQVEQGSRTLSSPAQTLVFGEAGVVGSGDGALVRVTSDPSAQLVRLGVDSSQPAALVVSAGAVLSGTNLTLDSTNQSTLSSTSLSGSAVNLDSGLISIMLGSSASSSSAQGLVLSNAALQNLQSSATSLALLSYSAIDIYGSGSIGGGPNAAGVYPVQNFTLHAAALRGDGGDVTVNAQTISLDDSADAADPGPGPVATPGGSLAFNAGTIQLGAIAQTEVNGVQIEGYDNVNLNALGGVLLESAATTASSTGSVTQGQFTLSVVGSAADSGNLTVVTPLLTAATAANQSLVAAGALDLEAPTGATKATVVGGLGADLDFTGQTVAVDSDVQLSSGNLKIEATTGDLTVGSAGVLNAGGISKPLNDLTEYTSGGSISLASDQGSVSVAAGSEINVAAPSGGGNGGTLAISAPGGTFIFAGSSLTGSGGTGGENGNFSLDAGTLNASSALGGNDLTPLETALNTGGFSQSQSIRIRGGTVSGVAYDDVYLEGSTAATQVNAANYSLSADVGSIDVTGEINAAGPTGGTIGLTAAGSVTLGSGSLLTVAGQAFDDAGKGGAVTLSAGAETNGNAPASAQDPDAVTGRFASGTPVVDIQDGSEVDLSVVTNTGTSAKTIDLTNSGSSYLALPGATTFTLPSGTPGNDGLVFSSGGTVTSGGVTTSFAAGTVLSALPAGSSISLSTPGSVAFAGGGTGGQIPLGLAAGVDYTLGALGDVTGTLHVRAPQIASGSDLQVDPIDGTILNASNVVLEGYKIYAPAGGAITTALEGSAATSTAHDGTVYGDAVGFTANTSDIVSRLLTGTPNSAEAALYQVTPGAEIINLTGDLTLGSTWDLSTFRFGPDTDPSVPGSGVAGVLTMRAAGNLVFNYVSGAAASLSDGFTGYSGTSTSLWQSTLMSGQSWSYQLVAGADFSAANADQVQTAASLQSQNLGGSVELGEGSPALPTSTVGASTSTIVPKFYQVIRTGTGDITIAAGNDVRLLDPLATIYTAGTQAASLANFALPNLAYQSTLTTIGTNPAPVYQAVYSQSGGNVSISAQDDIGHFIQNGSGVLVDDSSKEMPTSWLYRAGFEVNGQFAAPKANGPITATTWWVDFNNFFEGVGALGGGNVTLTAQNDISNVDAFVPTNARMPDETPSASALVELGGGDLLVQAEHDISGGVYYVERGLGTLSAGGSIHTNSTRATLTQSQATNLAGNPADDTTWLPTTLFLGTGSFDVNAGGSLLLGPVANPFLLPQNLYNSFYNKTYFSTYGPEDSVNASALTGSLTLKDNVIDNGGAYYEGAGSLAAWYGDILVNVGSTYAKSQPWLSLVENQTTPFDPAFALLPPTLNATAFSGDIDLVGSLVLSPAATGTVNLLAAGAINGFQPNQIDSRTEVASIDNPIDWGSSTINLSDADPASLPGVAAPLSFPAQASGFNGATFAGTSPSIFSSFAALFNESGATDNVLQTKESLHTPGLLHADDSNPIRLYAESGDISGVTLYSGKFAQVEAGRDITDISFYIQNDDPENISLVSAGRDIVAYDPQSALREAAQTPGNQLSGESSAFPEGSGIGAPTAGDLQISGPGTLEILAGRNLNLGVGPSSSDGTSTGITSVGDQRDPYLPFAGASVVAGAGIGSAPDYAAFEAQFLAPGTTESTRYLPDLGSILGLSNANDAEIWTAFNQLPVSQQQVDALQIFYLVLRDSGRDHNTAGLPGSGNYDAGFAAIAALFPANQYQGDIALTSREIKTENGGDISLLAPGGQLTVGFDVSGSQPVDQGILTVDGGNISIFTHGNVNVGTSRIFTLNGGNEIIFSSAGNIAAGASSKTVQSAPPTRVIVDPQSGDVQTDLAGLATGGGIGVLETVVGAQASDVDLIAPVGSIDAGDAGIRASGNLNLAGEVILNAGNIQVGGKSSGVPTAAAPNLSGLSAASSAAGAASNEAAQVAGQQQNQSNRQDADLPSIVTVEVLGYGGE